MSTNTKILGNPSVRAVISRILAESVETEAYRSYRRVCQGIADESDIATIAKSPWWAFEYTKTFMHERWPEAEPVIATDPAAAYHYADFVIRGRFVEAEETIAKSGGAAKKWYLELFPDAKEDWVVNGWLDWMDI